MAEGKRNWTPVKSSRLVAVELDPMSRTMYAKFPADRNGNEAIYAYANVTVEQYNGIVNAPSIGRAFNQEIVAKKEEHPYTRIGSEKAEPEEPTAA